MTTPYDPQYGPPQGGTGYGQPQGGAGYGQPGPQGFTGGQPGMPGADPYAGAQTGYQGAYPGYQGQPGAPTGPSQPGFAAVNQLPGQNLAIIARKRAIRQILIGLGILALGVVITVATYAASSNGGGVVFYGLVVVGILWTIRGFVALARAGKLR